MSKEIITKLCLVLPILFILSIARADDTEIFFKKGASNTLCPNVSTSSFSTPIGVGSTNKDALSLEYIYQNVFVPSIAPSDSTKSTKKWSGNLKKYRYDSTNKVVVDVNGDKVFDADGVMINDSQSFWSAAADKTAAKVGQDYIESGGAGASIADYTSRTNVYTNSDDDADPTTVDIRTDFNTSNTYLTATDFGAADSSEKDRLINWALGDEDGDPATIGNRSWLMGDPVHSEPTVINYGHRNKSSNYSKNAPDIRIVLGTNSGFLHFYQDNLNLTDKTYTDDKVVENWAFIPNELLANIIKYKADKELDGNSRQYYGIDGVIAVYKDDKNQDGNICTKNLDCNDDGFKDGDINQDGDTSDSNIGEGDDQVFIVFGLRRGGKYYYAMDVSDPTDPKFLWKFADSSTDNSKYSDEIQQSWSTTQFGKVKYYNGSKVVTKLVTIITAGYDADKYDTGATDDGSDQGRGLFILDIKTGEIIWSALYGSSSNSSKTVFYSKDLKDSIPAPAKVIDVNGDGILDRIYMADMGGNVWRIDLFNQDVDNIYGSSVGTNTLYSNDSREFWSLLKLANLGKYDSTDGKVDRRFFNQIDFVKTRDTANGNFDAVLLGSGHRNNPYETTITNRFYMIKDPKVGTYKLSGTATCSTDKIGDPNCIKYDNKVITDIYPRTNKGTAKYQLADISSSCLSSYSTNGWRLDLAGTGEKNLSSSLTIKGNVSFTTYRPPLIAKSTTFCPVADDPDQYKFYLFNLQLGCGSFDLDGTSGVDISKTINNTGIPAKPFVITPDGKKLYILPSLGENPIEDDSLTLQTQTHFWYKKE